MSPYDGPVWPRCPTHLRPAGRSKAAACAAPSASRSPRPFLSAGYCHCTHCQRRTGTGSSANGRVPQEGFELLQGAEELRAYQPPGGVPKLFCRNCGSALFSGDPFSDVEVAVRLGALDDDPGIRPHYRQFVESAASWETIPQDGLDASPALAQRLSALQAGIQVLTGPPRPVSTRDLQGSGSVQTLLQRARRREFRGLAAPRSGSSAPVDGLRPCLAARWLTLNLPKPASATSPPAASSSEIVSIVVSTTCRAWLADSPVCAARPAQLARSWSCHSLLECRCCEQANRW